jgi:hypothetical protein
MSVVIEQLCGFLSIDSAMPFTNPVVDQIRGVHNISFGVNSRDAVKSHDASLSASPVMLSQGQHAERRYPFELVRTALASPEVHSIQSAGHHQEND